MASREEELSALATAEDYKNVTKLLQFASGTQKVETLRLVLEHLAELYFKYDNKIVDLRTEGTPVPLSLTRTRKFIKWADDKVRAKFDRVQRANLMRAAKQRANFNFDKQLEQLLMTKAMQQAQKHEETKAVVAKTMSPMLQELYDQGFDIRSSTEEQKAAIEKLRAKKEQEFITSLDTNPDAFMDALKEDEPKNE